MSCGRYHKSEKRSVKTRNGAYVLGRNRARRNPPFFYAIVTDEEDIFESFEVMKHPDHFSGSQPLYIAYIEATAIAYISSSPITLESIRDYYLESDILAGELEELIDNARQAGVKEL